MGNNYSVGVIGGGGWGTALAVLANRAGSSVTLCTRNQNVLASIEGQRTNEVYLPGVFIDPKIAVTSEHGEACRNDILVLAMPSQALRSACIAISDLLDSSLPIVLAAKGIERGSLLLMHEVVQSLLPRNPIAVISGPSFADEAAKGQPTAVTIACQDHALCDKLSYALGGRMFRPYLTDDIIAPQVGGAVKNVVAIACGIAIGRGLGENARAALVTRGFAEMARLCVVKGGRKETLMGLCGMGDLVLTCNSQRSRNFSFGMMLGQGKAAGDVLLQRGRTATEGVATVDSIVRLARKFGVSMPISEAVHRIVYEQAAIDRVVQDLLERPFVEEGG